MSQRPPIETNTSGEVRHVGVEIEFAGLDVDRVARMVQASFGGQVVRDAPYHITVEGTRFGTFIVALDSRHAHPHEEGLAQTASRISERLGEQTAAAVGAITQFVVPTEITSPPIPFPELDAMDEIVEALRSAGAQGTDASLLYAFGLHLNPEVAATDADYLTRHLKAYLLLSERLRRDVDMDLSRRVMSFADPFPEDYADLVLDVDYRPARDQLMDDYLRYNPDRNRELDCLPLFAFIDEARVRAAVDDPRIKPRPTFHYRLPNAALERAGWSISSEWRRWLWVENLAAASDSLAQGIVAHRNGNRSLIDKILARVEATWIV